MPSTKDIIERAGEQSFTLNLDFGFNKNNFQRSRSTTNAHNVRHASAAATATNAADATATVSDLRERHADEQSPESTERRSADLRSIVHINSELVEQRRQRGEA